MITFSGQIPIQGLGEDVKNLPIGAISGGALVPGDSCLCNCGLIADLDLGRITINYDNGVSIIFREYDRRSGFDWLDNGPTPITSGGEILSGGNVGAFLYVAFIWYSLDPCLPEGLILFDDPILPDQDPALRRIRLTTSGAATGVTSSFGGGGGGGGWQDGSTLERAGVRYGDFTGSYDDPANINAITIESQIITGWRAYENFPT